MGKDYFKALCRFAFKGVVLRTDALQILVASAIPAVFNVLGWPMPDNVGVAALAYIGYGIAVFLLIRFLTAPYFIWKEDQARISSLQSELDSPKRRERAKISDILVEHKMKTADEVTRIRRVISDREASTQEKKVAFRGSEMHVDKLFFDPTVEALWLKFHASANVAFQRWQEREISRKGEQREKIGLVEELRFGDACLAMDKQAREVINYLLYGETPQSNSDESPSPQLPPDTAKGTLR